MDNLIIPTLKIIISDDHSIYTDPSGRFWGNAGAGGIFYAEDTQKYCLAYRSKYVNEPHTWGVWGGAIDPGEDPKQAVKREIREEAGYTGNYKLKLLHIYKSGDFTYHTFLIIIDKEFQPELDWETEDYGWFDLNNFPDKLHFGLKPILPKLKKVEK